jgi:hypothetical protein
MVMAAYPLRYVKLMRMFDPAARESEAHRSCTDPNVVNVASPTIAPFPNAAFFTSPGR